MLPPTWHAGFPWNCMPCSAEVVHHPLMFGPCTAWHHHAVSRKAGGSVGLLHTLSLCATYNNTSCVGVELLLYLH